MATPLSFLCWKDSLSSVSKSCSIRGISPWTFSFCPQLFLWSHPVSRFYKWITLHLHLKYITSKNFPLNSRFSCITFYLILQLLGLSQSHFKRHPKLSTWSPITLLLLCSFYTLSYLNKWKNPSIVAWTKNSCITTNSSTSFIPSITDMPSRHSRI